MIKESSILIFYAAEKLEALQQYMKDEAEMQASLQAQLQTLYEIHVPAEIRENIDRKKEGDVL